MAMIIAGLILICAPGAQTLALFGLLSIGFGNVISMRASRLRERWASYAVQMVLAIGCLALAAMGTPAVF